MCQVLYYFWVMQATCPACSTLVDLFSSYIFARHAYARRNPTVQVVCPNCGALNAQHYRERRTDCSDCGHSFDPTSGPVRGKSADCPDCLHQFTIGHTISETGSPPTYRMYAKLVLTPDGTKEYLPIDDYDHALYARAVADLSGSDNPIPQGTIEPGYNTNQALELRLPIVEPDVQRPSAALNLHAGGSDQEQVEQSFTPIRLHMSVFGSARVQQHVCIL